MTFDNFAVGMPLVAALASIILIAIVSCIFTANTQPQIFGKLTSAFGSSNDTSADNTWYVGKGVKPDTYVKYAINNFGTNNNQTFIMTIYFQQYNATGKYWIAPVYVFDNPSKDNGNRTSALDNNVHLVRGTFLLSEEDMGVLQGSVIPPQLSQYKNAYENSLDWLNIFVGRSSPQSLSAPVWGKIASLSGIEIRLNGTENVAVPAGTFNTTMLTWHKRPAPDSKIWVSKDFPYPIKARFYVEVVNPPAPIQYEFELLEYGNGRPDTSTITSSNGSSIVIPEFPLGVLLPIVASIISVIMFVRKRKLG